MFSGPDELPYQCNGCQRICMRWQQVCPGCRRDGSLRRMRNNANSLREQRLVLGVDELEDQSRIKTNFALWDVLLDGGPELGMVLVIGGGEGTGKSTTWLAACYTADCERTLYVTGEEQLKAVGRRGRKLGYEALNAQTERCAIVAATHTEAIFDQAADYDPQLIVIDSQQTFASLRYPKLEPGSITQQRYITKLARAYADSTQAVVVIISQLTQGGKLAGPSRSKFMADATGMITRNEDSGVRKALMRKSRFCACHVEVHYDIYGEDGGGLGVRIHWVGKRVKGDKNYGKPDPTLYDAEGNYVGPTAGEVARRHAEAGLLAELGGAEGRDDEDDSEAEGDDDAPPERTPSASAPKPRAGTKAKLRLLRGGRDEYDPTRQTGGVDGVGYDLRDGDGPPVEEPDPEENAPPRPSSMYERATRVPARDVYDESDREAKRRAFDELNAARREEFAQRAPEPYPEVVRPRREPEVTPEPEPAEEGADPEAARRAYEEFSAKQRREIAERVRRLTQAGTPVRQPEPTDAARPEGDDGPESEEPGDDEREGEEEPDDEAEDWEEEGEEGERE